MKKEEVLKNENVEKSLMEEMNEVSGVDVKVESVMRRKVEKKWKEKVDVEKVMKCRVRWEISGVVVVGLEKRKLLYCILREGRKDLAMKLVISLEEKLKKGELK